MDKFLIEGPSKLTGTLPVSGSKNAALPLMAAALLADGPVGITNIPALNDIHTFNRVIEATGSRLFFDREKSELTINPDQLNNPEAPYDLVRKMRASFYMLGALVGKTGRAKVSLPGGCAWGPRPVDLHLKGMEAMGIDIELDSGYVLARMPDDGVDGGTCRLDPSSVGATINLVLAAVLKAREFTIENAALEPDVVLLCRALQKMGADIEGVGTSTLTIRRVDRLQPCMLSNSPDRIETGTYMIAAAMLPGSDITLVNCDPADLGVFPEIFQKTGAVVTIDSSRIRIQAPETVEPVSIETEIYPGFPTDLQAQWATMMTQAPGVSVVTDTIYTDRFSYVPELIRLGANLTVDNNAVIIQGRTELEGASVMSTDLRASVSLVLAGMAAAGRTEVLRVYHLDRGYENLETKLNRVGARIIRQSE